MDKKLIVWLHEELPKWESKGWISQESASAMKVFYGEIGPRKTPSLMRLVALFLGLLLVGLGIFLLFAGYWYSFSPAGRLDWCIALLLIALFVLGGGVWKAPRGGLVAEGIGLFFVLVLTMVTFLMADTYYTGAGIGIYCLIIMLLSMQAVYLLGSQLAMIAILGVSLLWSTSPHDITIWGEPAWLWVLLALGVPFYLERLRSRSTGLVSVLWLSWAYVAALFGAFFFTINSYQLSLGLFFVASLSAVTFALGSVSKEQGLWTLPFRGIGALGLIYVVVDGTFLGTWEEEAATVPGIGTMVLAIAALVLVAGAIRALWREKQGLEILITLCPLVVGLLVVTVHMGVTALTASILFNTYIVILAAVMFFRGGMTNRVALVNGCIFAFLAMIGARFFDPAFTFVERGLTFIIAGVAIFVVNLFYMWRKHAEREAINSSVGRANRRLQRKGASTIAVQVTRKSGGISADSDSNIGREGTAYHEDATERSISSADSGVINTDRGVINADGSVTNVANGITNAGGGVTNGVSHDGANHTSAEVGADEAHVAASGSQSSARGTQSSRRPWDLVGGEEDHDEK